MVVPWPPGKHGVSSAGETQEVRSLADPLGGAVHDDIGAKVDRPNDVPALRDPSELHAKEKDERIYGSA